MPLCFATNNMHKLAEVRSLLHGKIELKNLHDIGCEEELPETTGTIPGNARQKAEFVHAKYKMDCFADDSGLEVHALGNAPGVDSAIYAGPQRSHDLNIALLLSNLEKIYDRKARFLTVIALILEGKLFQFDGVLEGRILRSKRGDGGFGYDPVFVPDGSNKSLAEMSMEEKNKISHRAKAIGKLVAFLESNNRSL